jgi:hypothetical protein
MSGSTATFPQLNDKLKHIGHRNGTAGVSPAIAFDGCANRFNYMRAL